MSTGKWIIVGGTYLLIGLGSFLGAQLHVDLSPTTLSANESEEYLNYQEYSKQFPVYDSSLVVSISAADKFETREDFQKIDRLSKSLQGLLGVFSLNSITSLELPERTAFGNRNRKFLPLKSEKAFKKAYSKLHEFSDVTPKFISEDRTAMRIFLEVDWNELPLEKLNQLLESYHFDETYLSGSGILKANDSKNVAKELVILPLIASVILLLLFLVWFQELKSLLVIISLLGLNLALVLCVFWVCGIDIGMLTATVPLLIVVLSFCDIVHLIYRFKQKEEIGTLEERVASTARPLRISLWLTSLTTFSAFAMFLISGVDEIIEFAIVTCTGIVIAYLSARYILPVFIVAFRLRAFRRKEAFSRVQVGLIGLLKHSKLVAAISIAVIVICAFGVWQFSRVNSTFQQQIGATSSIARSMLFTDKHFDGVRTIEVIVKAENVLTPTTIQLVDTIENFLLVHYGCRSVFSVNSAIKRMNRYNHFGVASAYSLPDTLNAASFERLIQFGEKLGLSNAMTDDQRLLRIVGRLPDIGSAAAAKQNVELETFISSLEDEDRSVFISGFSYVQDQSTERVTDLILWGIAISLLVAGLITGFIFRSWKIAMITVLSNLWPLLAALLTIEFLGMGLNATSVMALSILLGLSLDDTIYFLGSNYKKGNTNISTPGIETSIRENAFPAIVTSLILAVGFGVLAFSDLQSSSNIGILVASMLLIALISDLVIFPALLGIMTAKKSMH